MTHHISESHYRDIMANAATYNSRLCIERRLRLPFLDSHTGVAQNHSNLWMPYRLREPGKCHGQLYSYPAKRWKKKCHLVFTDFLLPKAMPAVQNNTATTDTDGNTGVPAAEVSAEDSNDPTLAHADDTVTTATAASSSTDYRGDEYYGEWDESGEYDGMDKQMSDSSDYEETYVKRRGKKNAKKKGSKGAGGGAEPSGRTSGRRRDKDKDKDKERDKEAATSSNAMESSGSSQSPEKERVTRHSEDKRTSSGSKEGSSSSTKPCSRYCDFCLGDENENKKTGEKEEMVSCADCGRSGHPTCLQFTKNMIISVKKYPWQCIECKSCGLCGTSDNDDQLLFCDDCDRGYHMYCLKPPLSEPPEGSWSCHLCIAEFYGGSRPPTMTSSSSSS